MSLPITSINVWLARSPDTPENMERSIWGGAPCSWWGERERGSGGRARGAPAAGGLRLVHLRDRGHRDVAPGAQRERRRIRVRRVELHGGDGGRGRRAVVVVRDRLADERARHDHLVRV